VLQRESGGAIQPWQRRRGLARFVHITSGETLDKYVPIYTYQNPAMTGLLMPTSQSFADGLSGAYVPHGE